jgi:hypothetical protein
MYVPASCHYKNIIKNGIQDGIQKLSQLIFIISFIIYEDTYLRQE